MTTNKTFLLLTVLLLYLFPCQAQEKNLNFGKKSTVQLEKQFDITLKSRTFLTYDGTDLFCWDNIHNRLYKFDFKSRTFTPPIKIEIKNPYEYEEMVCVGRDSLITFSWIENYNANLINGKGKLLKQYNIAPKNHLNYKESNTKLICYCDLYGTIGKISHNGFFYYATKYLGESTNKGKLFSSARLNLKSGVKEYVTEFPSIYNKYHWGFWAYNYPYITFNSKEQMIISYPACHQLYLYDIHTKKQKAVNAGSSLFKNIPPFSNKKEIKAELKDEYIKHYQTNYAYGIIAYDKKHKLYYRQVRHPNKNWGKSANKTRKMSIIVLDEKFHFLGEVELPADKNYYRFIVTEQGIVASYIDFNNRKYGFTVFNIKLTNKH